jgi:KaiC/GvpD/RAD55 family RecA-like ATPase
MAKKKKAQAEEVTCPQCNHPSPVDSDECEQCGASLKVEEEEQNHAAEGEDPSGDHDLEELMSVSGIKKAKAVLLYEAGFRTVGDIQNADAAQLAEIKGIGDGLAQKMVRNAKEMSAHQDDRNLASWLAGEDGGLSAWLSGEEMPAAAPLAEAVAAPEIKPDASLVRWLAGEEESIDAWLQETTELAKPEAVVPKRELQKREAEVSQLRDILIEKIRQIESVEFDPQALVDEVTKMKSDLEGEKRRAARLEEELENVKRGSIAVIKFIKKQQGADIKGENLADKLAEEMAAKETMQGKVGELEGIIASLREKAEKDISEMPPEMQELKRKEMVILQREAQLDAMEQQLKTKEGAIADGLIDYASSQPSAASPEVLEAFATKERALLERIEELDSKLEQAQLDLKHKDEVLEAANAGSTGIDQEVMEKLKEAQGVERNLVLREQEVQRLKEELRIREDEMNRLKEPLAYKEDEIIRREEDLMYRERLLQEEMRKVSQMQTEVGSQDEITLKRRLEELQGQVTVKEEEVRNKERYLHVKEEELRIREQGLIDEEIEKRELDRLAEIKMEKVKTGTSRLDDLLLGGVPFGTNVLIYGPPFAGKEVLVNAFIAGGLKMGIPAIWVITEKSPREIRDEMMYLLSGYEEYEKKGLVRYIDSYSMSMGEEAGDEFTEFIESPTDYEAIQRAIESAAKGFKEKHQYYRLAFRSISTMIAYLDPNTAFRFLSPVVGRRKRDRAVAMYTIEKGVHGEQEIQMLGSLMDGMIEFKVENLNTFLAVRGISDVQSRAFIRYSATKQGVNIGSFSLDHIR